MENSAGDGSSSVVLWCNSWAVKVCRICSKPDNDDFISVRLVQQQVSIAEKIFAISGVEVMKDRRLPQNICLKCLDRVNQAFELRQQCIQADSRLCESLPDNNKLSAGSPQHAGIVEFLEEPAGEQSSCKADAEEDYEEGDPEEQDSSLDTLVAQSDTISEHAVNSFQTQQVIPNQTHTIRQNSAWRLDFDRKHPAIGGDLYQCLICNQTLKTHDTLLAHLERHEELCENNVESIPKLSITSSDVSDLRIEIQAPHNEKPMEVDGEATENMARSVTIETLDEEYATDEEYLELDDGGGNEESEEYEPFQDEVDVDSEVGYGYEDEVASDLKGKTYRPQVSKAVRLKSKQQSVLQRVLQIPEKYRRIVADQKTYMIVELLHERCCCCAKFFTTDQQLQEHMKEHLEKHSREQNTTWKYRCEYCGKAFKFSITYTFHLRIRQRRQFYLCGLCNLVMDTEKRMKSHMLRNEQHASFFNLTRAGVSDQYYVVVLTGIRCCRCRTYFERYEDFNEHIRVIHSQQLLAESRHTVETHPFKCGVCKRRFTRKALLEQHLAVGTIKTEESTRSFVKYCCKLCDYSTYTIERIEAHLYGAVHSDELAKVHLEPLNNDFKRLDTIYHCCSPECKKSFLDTEILQDHFRDCHAETLAANQRANSEQESKQGAYECFICAVRLENLNALRDHQAQHALNATFRTINEHCVDEPISHSILEVVCNRFGVSVNRRIELYHAGIGDGIVRIRD
uniref:ZAD domain-containing protein n=1 Tax=Anopheles albimanus TaxID=7167 RepID=A0A182F538_ANOAL